MSYATAEVSRQDSRPVYLYKLTVGDTTTRLTNAQTSLVLDAFTHVPAVIHHTQPKVNSDEPGSSIELILDLDDEASSAFARQWVASAPEMNRGKVVITRMQVDEVSDTVITFWIGFIASSNYEKQGNEVKLLCKSLDNLFTLQGPRKNWGTTCNHVHYGPECTLDANLYRDLATVTAIASDGITYTIPGVPSPVVRHNGGMLEKSGGFERRMIVSRTGNDFVLRYPIPEIAVGDQVSIFEGCQHDLTDCEDFPNPVNTSLTNMENFGATPYRPTLNPFTQSLEYL